MMRRSPKRSTAALRHVRMLHHPRTKIVATLGPASRDERTILDLVRAGVDVFRLNAAHSDAKMLTRDIHAIRRVQRQLKVSIGILVDLQGPKIRVGPFLNAEPIWLKRGEDLVISTKPDVVGQAAEAGQTTRIGTGYPRLAKDVRTGERVLLDDGIIELRVLRVEGTEIHTRVVYGGLLKQFKGINLPGSKVSAESLSAKDLADLEVVLRAGVDFVALSFVREADDVVRLKKRIAELGGDVQVIAKIERPEAVKNLTAILAAADAVMVARGDMGVELGAEAVPAIQKRIIRMSLDVCKPCITATQMLESMITNPRPTRAEASDVANAIYDGTSAVMLSAETASGKHPLRAVKIMQRIIRHTEDDMFSRWEYQRRRRLTTQVPASVAQSTVRAAAYAASESGARYIVVYTESGATAQMLAAERTPHRLVAFTPHQQTFQRLSLVWGIVPRRVSKARTSSEMTLEGARILQESGMGKKGDRIVVIFGASREKGMTNIMKIRTLE